MSAPNKLYLEAVQNPNTGLTELQCTEKPISKIHSIPYIRKDALLDWANGLKDGGNDKFGVGWDEAVETIIDKINEL